MISEGEWPLVTLSHVILMQLMLPANGCLASCQKRPLSLFSLALSLSLSPAYVVYALKLEQTAVFFQSLIYRPGPPRQSSHSAAPGSQRPLGGALQQSLGDADVE